MTVTMDEILRLVSLQLGIKNVREGDHFLEQLNAESMDVLNIIAAVEGKFQVEIKEAEIPDLLTPRDLYQFVNSRR
jgi:acyl carrier protein